MCFETKQKTSSSGTQQGTTQSNYWNQPGMQEFMSGYQGQFSGPNISQVQAPVNAWQTGAVANQSQLPGGLGNAFNTANTVASNGIDPNRIQQFMSPYIQSVVNPTIEAQNQQNQGALSNLRGNSATRGALGNNTGQSAAYMAGVAPAQNAAIANLYNTGFNQAGQLATQDVMSRLQGAGQVGNLTGVNTGANTAQFGMGETMRNASMQNQITPFQLWNQGLQGQLGFGNLAGQNTSGTTTGTQNTTSTPGLGQSLAGIAGMGMAGFNFGNSMGWGIPSWAANGGVIRRDGGAVKGYNDGGSVLPPFHGSSGETFADKVARAHETVSKLRASGGRTEKPADKGTPGRFAERRVMGDPWAATVTEERGQDPFMSPDQAQRMMAFQPTRPMQYELSELRGFSAGGTPDNSQYDELFNRAPMPFPGFGSNIPATGLRGQSNAAPMGPAFAGNPFAQFMPSGEDGPALPPQTTGQMFPEGGDPLTTSNVMEAYNPNGPPRSPQGSMVPTSSTAPTPNPTEAAAPRPPMRTATPEEEFANILLGASGPNVFGGGAQAAAANHSRRVQELNAQLQADQLAQQLAHQNAQMALQRSAHDLNREELAERTRHNQATEAARAQNKPETAFDVASANAAAKAAQEREAAVAAGQDSVRRLDQMSTLLSNPNMPQGRFADWEVEGRRIASALLPGVNLEGVPEAEAFRTLSNKMALAMRSTANGEGMPGAMSDADRVFLLQSVPRLQNTPAGNRLIVNSMRDTELYRMAANTEAARYINTNRSNRGLSEHMAAWMQQNPMERVVPGHAETRRAAEAVAATTAAPTTAPAATAAPQAVWTRTTPENQQRAIEDLRKAVGTPELQTRVQQFNATFNNGQPGLAESLVQDDESQAFRQRENPDLNAPHNLLRRWFGQPPVQ